jgi:hypothetical protein
MIQKFDELVSRITAIGLEHHAQTILENSRRNAPFIGRTIRDVERMDETVLLSRQVLRCTGAKSYRRIGNVLGRCVSANRAVTVVSTDGAYIQCLKAGIKPDWVVTIDPHPTRIVRWFGDPDWERTAGMMTISSDKTSQKISERTALSECSEYTLGGRSSGEARHMQRCPANVVARTAGFERYWFAPLVDDPDEAGITRTICAETGLPALNTGGTVGTAAWAFAHWVLKAREWSVGWTYGYPADTPLKNTQEWNLTGGDPDLYPKVPERGYYTSPTYFWYRSNFLDLLESADARVTNCSGAGLLYGDRVDEMSLEAWLKSSS